MFLSSGNRSPSQVSSRAHPATPNHGCNLGSHQLQMAAAQHDEARQKPADPSPGRSPPPPPPRT